MTKHELGPLPEKDYLGDDASYGYDACSMHAYALAEVERAVLAERERIASSLRRSGATLPAPEVKGTPESGIITGLCIALTLVETP